MLFLTALVDDCLENGICDLTVFHFFPWVTHVTHLLQLFACLSVLCHGSQLFPTHHALQFFIEPTNSCFLEDPVVLLQVDFCKDVLKFLLREDTCPFFLENSVLFTRSMRVDGRQDCLYAIEDVSLNRDAAVRHYFLHFFSTHVEILV